VDLAHDLVDWVKLNDNEQHFILMVLAFFAASDGIVLENVALRFMKDVQIPEVRSSALPSCCVQSCMCVVGFSSSAGRRCCHWRCCMLAFSLTVSGAFRVGPALISPTSASTAAVRSCQTRLLRGCVWRWRLRRATWRVLEHLLGMVAGCLLGTSRSHWL
jgi:hypothetical protein